MNPLTYFSIFWTYPVGRRARSLKALKKLLARVVLKSKRKRTKIGSRNSMKGFWRRRRSLRVTPTLRPRRNQIYACWMLNLHKNLWRTSMVEKLVVSKKPKMGKLWKRRAFDLIPALVSLMVYNPMLEESLNYSW